MPLTILGTTEADVTEEGSIEERRDAYFG